MKKLLNGFGKGKLLCSFAATNNQNMYISTNARKQIALLSICSVFSHFSHAQVKPQNFLLGRLEAQDNTDYHIAGYGVNYPTGNTYHLKFGRYSEDSIGFNRIVKLFKVNDMTYSLTKAVSGELPFMKVNVNRYAADSEIKTTALFEVNGTPSADNGAAIHLVADYVGSMEALINSYIINRGSDNTFVRGGTSSTVNNITRIDLILEEPVAIPADLDSRLSSGFLIMERGGNDNFKFAAISSLDLTDTTVASFGAIALASDNSWGSTGQNINSVVMQKSGTDVNLKPSQNIGSQSISGVFISLNDLGMPAGSIIYGISLAGNNATDFITFPATSPETGNGLDFMAGGGFFTKALLVSGNIWHDINGDAIYSESESGVANNLWANLVDSDGNLISSVQVNANGSYQLFIAEKFATDDNYSVILTNKEHYEGEILTEADSLKNGFIFTGTNLENVPNTGNLSGKIDIGSITADKTDINFGIQIPPTAGSNILTSVLNPGLDNHHLIPNTAFVSEDTDGTIAGIRIESFPTNITRITIGSTTYTSEDWPEEGVEIITNILGEPTVSVSIDPIDGDVTSDIVFSVKDNAGAWSQATGSLQIPFHTLTISGNVFHDANGLTDNIVNGEGTNLDGNLYAYLVDATSGTIIAKSEVLADGTFSFAQLGAGYDYEVHISTTELIVGTEMTSPVLPNDWEHTGEYIGTGEGSDETTNGIIHIGIINDNVSNVNFGIQMPPTANVHTHTITTPTEGTFITLDGDTGNPPIPTGEDYEDGSLSNGKTIRFVTLPINTTLWYDGFLVEENAAIDNFDPALLEIEFSSASVGTTSTYFEFEYQDAAGSWPKEPGTYTIDWSTPLNMNFITVDVSATNIGSAKTYWDVATNENIAHYEIEFNSSLNNNWIVLAKVQSGQYIKSANGIKSYQYLHINPVSGVNMYRIKSVEQNGNEVYSKVVKLNLDNSGKIQLIPNPAYNYINLITNTPSEILGLQIIDITGKIVWSNSAFQSTVDISSLAAGTYTMNVNWKSKESESIKFVKQ